MRAVSPLLYVCLVMSYTFCGGTHVARHTCCRTHVCCSISDASFMVCCVVTHFAPWLKMGVFPASDTPRFASIARCRLAKSSGVVLPSGTSTWPSWWFPFLSMEA